MLAELAYFFMMTIVPNIQKKMPHKAAFTIDKTFKVLQTLVQ